LIKELKRKEKGLSGDEKEKQKRHETSNKVKLQEQIIKLLKPHEIYITP
jgi:hypothetical protein